MPLTKKPACIHGVSGNRPRHAAVTVDVRGETKGLLRRTVGGILDMEERSFRELAVRDNEALPELGSVIGEVQNLRIRESGFQLLQPFGKVMQGLLAVGVETGGGLRCGGFGTHGWNKRVQATGVEAD